MTVAATLGVVLGAIYMLSVYRRIFHGEITHEENKTLEDLGLRELLVTLPLILLLINLSSLFPPPLLPPASLDMPILLNAII